MFRHITTGGAAGGSTLHDRQPVRRSSYMAGHCEGRIWRRTDRRELRRVLLGARRFEVVTRQPGRRSGALGHVALEVLELLAHLIDHRTGRLEPALAFLMRRLRRSKDAVVRALAALRTHGFADWLRRFEPVEGEGPGPRVRQTSNAYALRMPARAARLLGVQGQDVPLPDDLAQVVEDRREEHKLALTGLGLGELGPFVVDDGPLGRALAALGRHVQERESGRRSESQAKSFI